GAGVRGSAARKRISKRSSATSTGHTKPGCDGGSRRRRGIPRRAVPGLPGPRIGQQRAYREQLRARRPAARGVRHREGCTWPGGRDQRPAPRVRLRTQGPRARARDDPPANLPGPHLLPLPGGRRPCRASELVGLGVQYVFYDEGLVRILGKGSKERVVPVGRRALGAVALYTREIRPRFDRGRGRDKVFLNARGTPLSRVGAWGIIRRA